MDLVDLLSAIGVISASCVSAVAIFSNHSMQKTSIMAGKRSNRIDKMREHTTGILNAVKQMTCEISDINTTKDLLDHYHGFISLLQFQDDYNHDKSLMTQLKAVVDLCLTGNPDKVQLEYEVKALWWLCNVYIGADFERLKNESRGRIKNGGMILKEAKGFDDFHREFNVDRYIIFNNSPVLKILEQYYPMTQEDKKMLEKKLEKKIKK